MRRSAILSALLLSSCATTQTPSNAAPHASQGRLAPVRVEFASAEVTRAGAELTETKYSEKAEDVAITAKIYSGGVVTILGNVGLGKKSSYGGIGLSFSIHADGKPVDARSYKAVTFRLSSPTPRKLRLRLSGSDRAKRDGGCYPVYTQAVGPEMKSYTIPLAKFQAESWCAAKAESVLATTGNLWGFEVADTTLSRDPTAFSIGPITLEP